MASMRRPAKSSWNRGPPLLQLQPALLLLGRIQKDRGSSMHATTQTQRAVPTYLRTLTGSCMHLPEREGSTQTVLHV